MLAMSSRSSNVTHSFFFGRHRFSDRFVVLMLMERTERTERKQPATKRVGLADLPRILWCVALTPCRPIPSYDRMFDFGFLFVFGDWAQFASKALSLAAATAAKSQHMPDLSLRSYCFCSLCRPCVVLTHLHNGGREQQT